MALATKIITLSAEDIAEFKQIALDEWSVSLTDEQAKEQAIKAVQFGQLMNTFDTNDPLVKQLDKEENLNE
jgi:hypothetical protein